MGKKFTVCIGNFDGVHLGHRKIMSETLKLSRKLNVCSTALSIMYPWGYYFPNFPGLIYTIAKRVELILSLGIKNVVTVDIEEIKDIEPEEYILALINQGMVGLVVGEDFTFGKGARGNTELLRELSRKLKFELVIVPHLKRDGRKISSSWIRELLAQGKIELANELLGSPYTISGKVYQDNRLGTKLGFPTANISRGIEKVVTPRSGVYIVKSIIGSRLYYGLLNIGFRPTVNFSKEIKYEVYFLDFSGDLYGKRLEIELLKFLRPELKFASIDELVHAIRRDERIARKWVSKLDSQVV
ncbi:riboflavin biosynthesis protein RibF [Kosmotoga olearia]|uniref:Riboflavin biosynthesis protein n=1 Tax=Kosmotoga olearia (strain ATCC BAA-1733 / DSM 21960 / TBF 19.5.1) TaxID=521045 RepID=C5CI76_KOSOT|nr:riboflavin biosynthesis protein RibF [Kosmotoga olearia]ACR80778.1 riboflavin biosynthesis protein RibF [Kosmotoga olearia TBF 19.5.1]MDK2952739.1 riboflavin kinase / adenylyltransferase [Kosmotoga sp.]